MKKPRFGSWVIDMRVPNVGRLKLSTGVDDESEFLKRRECLRRLVQSGRTDVLRALQAKTLTLAAVYEMYGIDKDVSAPPPPTEHLVLYFIQMVRPGNKPGPIKIGTTRNVSRRLAQIRVSNPYPLKLLAPRDVLSGHEMLVHNRLSASRLRGEWFSPTPEVLAEVEYWAAA